MDQAVAAQAIQLTGVEQHLALSKELSEAQKASLVLGEQMRGSSASLALELDSASVVAGRVSSKLDKVNQALGRVEKASSVLTTVSSMLSIPCQFAEHLHWRLFALFVMPAIVLYFWKPRKYSYSLMATYGKPEYDSFSEGKANNRLVFLETLTSFAAEHRDSISGAIGRLGWLCQAITMGIFYFLGQHIRTLVILAALVACIAIWTAYKSIKIENHLERKVIALDKDYKIANHYYMEHRLRNSKPLRDESDRFRRAATVC